MATQKELVAVVAKEMGVPIETVTVIDRYLAEAGLRTRAARGRGNTPMTYRDAANLIIATAWEANPKDAVSIVRNYSELLVTRSYDGNNNHIERDFLGKTFGESLANLIESVAAEREAFSDYSRPDAMRADVVMLGPHPGAEIVIHKGEFPFTYEYGDRRRRGDLRRLTGFSQITLGYVGEAIAEGFSK